MKPFTKEELGARLTRLDERMQKEGVPLRFRPLECFKDLYGPLPDGELRKRLFDGVTVWFLARYGKSAVWDGVLARVPVLVRGQVYLAAIPFVTEDTIVQTTDQIEGLPKQVARSLTADEVGEIGRRLTATTEAVSKLYRLRVDDHILEKDERALVRRALFDFEHTASSLRVSGDTQNAIFHSHAAAEKFLKVALKRAGWTKSLKSLHHDLAATFAALVELQKRFSWLESSVNALRMAAPDMEIRYRDVARSMEDAVRSYNASLNICGTLAGIWLFDFERGGKQAEFLPGRFYVDGARRTFLCMELKSPHKACLRLFMGTPPRGLVMADMVIDALYSSLYLEVTHPIQVAALRVKYDYHLKNRGELVTPEELGVRMASGPEGNYVTATHVIEIDGPIRKKK